MNNNHYRAIYLSNSEQYLSKIRKHKYVENLMLDIEKEDTEFIIKLNFYLKDFKEEFGSQIKISEDLLRGLVYPEILVDKMCARALDFLKDFDKVIAAKELSETLEEELATKEDGKKGRVKV